MNGPSAHAAWRPSAPGRPLERALQWWFGQLFGWVPQAVREAIYPPRELNLLVPQGADVWEIRRMARGCVMFHRVLALDDGPLPPADLAESLRGRADPHPELVLALPSSLVLRQCCTLPLATERDLRRALSHEMDRFTPFEASQAYFDHSVLTRDPGSGRIEVELVLARRVDVDELLARAGGLGLAPSRVDVLGDSVEPDAGSRPLGLDLLPPERRARRIRPQLVINAGLVALALALVGVAMGEVALRRQALAEALEREIAPVAREARRLVEIRSQIEASRQARAQLVAAHASAPSVTALLLEVSELLPDDTYLEELHVGQGRLEMRGRSLNTPAVVHALESSGRVKDTVFQSTGTEGGGKDGETAQFQLQATIVVAPVHESETPP